MKLQSSRTPLTVLRDISTGDVQADYVDDGEDEDESDRSKMAKGYKQPGADWSSDAFALSHTFVTTTNFGEGCYLGKKCNGAKGLNKMNFFKITIPHPINT